MVSDADLLRGLDLRPPLGGGGGGGNTGTTEGGAPVRPTGASHGTTAIADSFVVAKSVRGFLAAPAAAATAAPAAPVATTATRSLAFRAGAAVRGIGIGLRGLGFFGALLRGLPVIGAFFALADLASSGQQEEAVATQTVFDNFLEGRSDAEKQRAFEIYRTQGAAGLSRYLTENLGFSEDSVNEFTNALKELPKLQEQAGTDRTRNAWLTIGGLVLGGLFALCTGGVGAIFLGACTGMCYGNLLNMGCRYIPGLAPDFGSLLRGRPNNSVYTPRSTTTATA